MSSFYVNTPCVYGNCIHSSVCKYKDSIRSMASISFKNFDDINRNENFSLPITDCVLSCEYFQPETPPTTVYDLGLDSSLTYILIKQGIITTDDLFELNDKYREDWWKEIRGITWRQAVKIQQQMNKHRRKKYLLLPSKPDK